MATNLIRALGVRDASARNDANYIIREIEAGPLAYVAEATR